MIRILHFHRQGPGLIPGLGTRSHKLRGAVKKKKKKHSFIEISVKHYILCPLKAFNSMFSSIFADLCIRDHNQF